jgi:hypothetical protein
MTVSGMMRNHHFIEIKKVGFKEVRLALFISSMHFTMMVVRKRKKPRCFVLSFLRVYYIALII